MFLHVSTRCFCVCFWLDVWCIWASILSPFWHRFGIQKHMFFCIEISMLFCIDFMRKWVQKGIPKRLQKLPFWHLKSTRFPRGAVFESHWLIWADFDAFFVVFWSRLNAQFLPFWHFLVPSLDFPGLLGVSARMLLSSLRAIANMPLHFCAFQTSPPSCNPQSGSAGLAKRKQFLFKLLFKVPIY